MEGLINKMKGIHKDPNRVLFSKSGSSPPSSLGSYSAGGSVAASILLKKRLTLPFLAFLAALALGLMFMLPGGLLQAQDSTTIEYAENGEDPVATFTAEDLEGVTPIHWSVPTDLSADEIDGIVDADDADNGDFTIDKDGVLKFNIEDTNDGSSPGSPTSRTDRAASLARPTPTKWSWLPPTLRQAV